MGRFDLEFTPALAIIHYHGRTVLVVYLVYIYSQISTRIFNYQALMIYAQMQEEGLRD
jgi:hypothetical protein